jgi:hypothetical protein
MNFKSISCFAGTVFDQMNPFSRGIPSVNPSQEELQAIDFVRQCSKIKDAALPIIRYFRPPLSGPILTAFDIHKICSETTYLVTSSPKQVGYLKTAEKVADIAVDVITLSFFPLASSIKTIASRVMHIWKKMRSLVNNLYQKKAHKVLKNVLQITKDVLIIVMLYHAGIYFLLAALAIQIVLDFYSAIRKQAKGDILAAAVQTILGSMRSLELFRKITPLVKESLAHR